jgi:hypothetical protein
MIVNLIVIRAIVEFNPGTDQSHTHVTYPCWKEGIWKGTAI